MTLIPMTLRLEARDGSASEEYRIYDGEIEVRELQPTEDDWDWHRLTPEQLSDHVKRNTVVAQWLNQRLGWRRLLRACVADQTPTMSKLQTA
jgi:hypothetical protein